jgi:hypothetical protein
MKAIVAVVLTAIGLAGSVSQCVADSSASVTHPLSVQIDANDDESGNLVNSYVSRELRSLKDVTINAAPQPTFVIHCMCLPTVVADVKVGYVVSFVITSNLQPLKYIAENKQFTDVLDKSPEAKVNMTKMFLTQMCRLTQQFEDQIILRCPSADLHDKCKSFVATFDVKYLNPLRENQN